MAPSPYIFIISIGPVDMNKYARFDEIPSRTLKDIKETKRNGRTDVKTVYPPTNTVCGGYKNRYLHGSCSRANSAIYIAAGCLQKIFIYTAAVQEPNPLYTLLPGLYIHKTDIPTAAIQEPNRLYTLQPGV